MPRTDPLPTTIRARIFLAPDVTTTVTELADYPWRSSDARWACVP